MVIDFNSHCAEILSYSDGEFNSKGNDVDGAYFLSKPEGNRGRDLSLDFIVVGPHASGSKKGFKLVTGRKNCKRYFGR